MVRMEGRTGKRISFLVGPADIVRSSENRRLLVFLVKPVER